VTENTKSIMDYFPLPSPRKSQERVIKAIDKAFESGRKIVILEAPVGSGKSAIAMTLARAAESAHVITPRKSLQDQYLEDFKDDVVLMKGRNAYPCIIEADPPYPRKIHKIIMNGELLRVSKDEPNCANAPCKNAQNVYNSCVRDLGFCPYSLAMEIAQKSPIVIHNIHSFLFQTNFGNKFEQREIMIIDEAHELENAVRGFITKKFFTRARVDVNPSYSTVESWCNYLGQDEHLPEETSLDRQKKAEDEGFRSERDKYIDKIETFRLAENYYRTGFTVRMTPVMAGAARIGTTFEFIPHSLGNSVTSNILQFGEKVLLMSGTIYDHDQYCRSLGIDPAEALSIRISSSFPKENRPVYLKPNYQTDTSFANYRENFEDVVEIVDNIQNIFKDVKGLIHAPSYESAWELARHVPGNRLLTHTKHDFNETLKMFYDSDKPLILVSPVCQQGVDFKDDRARFQIIIRVPYMNTQDEFVEFKAKNDFNWYNYQALVVFGQMLGRPVRSESDFGATFLLDSRFNKFVQRNAGRLPNWVKESFIYK